MCYDYHSQNSLEQNSSTILCGLLGDLCYYSLMENEKNLQYRIVEEGISEPEESKNDDKIYFNPENHNSYENLVSPSSVEKNNEKNRPKIFKINKCIKTNSFLSKKREKKKRIRYKDKDNIKNKIARDFFNTYLIEQINHIIKKEGSYLKLRKFPRNFFINVIEKKNEEIWNLNLENIIEKRDLYRRKNKDSNNPNLDMINKLKSEESKNIMKKLGILKNEIKNLYKEYLESEHYNMTKLPSIKKQFDIDYFEKYKNCSGNFIN